MTSSFVLTVLLVIAVIWYILNWREQKRAASGLPRHSGGRLIFAAIAALTILFSGGCGSLLMATWIADGMRSNDYVSWEIIALFSLPPLAVGILVWWLSMRRRNV